MNSRMMANHENAYTITTYFGITVFSLFYYLFAIFYRSIRFCGNAGLASCFLANNNKDKMGLHWFLLRPLQYYWYNYYTITIFSLSYKYKAIEKILLQGRIVYCNNPSRLAPLFIRIFSLILPDFYKNKNQLPEALS